MMLGTADQILEQLAQAERLWSFLDYDGTLADFAPTPQYVNPDPAVIDLITDLAEQARIRVAVISGRRLSHVEALLPVPGILLAGTYGVELKTPEGERIFRAEKKEIRPALDALKPRWLHLIDERRGFFLEDKFWALALHARFAGENEAEEVLSAARRLAVETVEGESFRLLGGHRFLEIGPQLAHKGKTVSYLLNRYPWPHSVPLYVGDDDKDEEAFGVVQAHGGFAVLVAPVPRRTRATCRLDSPRAACQWLAKLTQLVGQEVPS